MASAFPFRRNFKQTSLSLRVLTEQLHQGISTLSLNSAETYQKFREDFLIAWKKWSETAKNYQKIIQEMPKELRQRAFVKNTLQDLDKFQGEVRNFLTGLNETSLSDFRKHLDQRLKNTDLNLRSLQIHLQKLSQQIAELGESPLIQKFLRGETVLADKQNMQWARKINHAGMGLFFLYVYVFSGWPKSISWSIGGAFLIWAASLETMRHLNPRVNQWVWKFFKPIMRESEKNKINSGVFFIVSITLVYLIFPTEVTILTMFFIAIGDPLASVVGVKWGRHKITSNVSLEGSLACFSTCAFMALLSVSFIFETNLSISVTLLFSLLAGITGALAESSFKKLDDNLVMPLVSAPVLWVLMKVFSIL